jgi:hypothetical protein
MATQNNMDKEINKQLQERFFMQPEWSHIENMIMAHVTPLIDMSTIDTSQPAEHVKAEIMGRTLAYESLMGFLRDSRLISRQLPDSNSFK